MSRMLKNIACIRYKKLETRVILKKTVPQLLRPIMAEIDCYVVYCPKVGNKYCIFEQWMVDIVNKFTHFPHL